MDSYALLEPHKRVYTVAEISSRTGASARAIYAGIALHRAWIDRASDLTQDNAWPAGAIAAVKVRGRWLIPLGAALRLADPVRYERENQERKAAQRAESHARAEALDAPALVAAAMAAIDRLLPGVEVRAIPATDSWTRDYRFEVGLYEDGRLLIGTWGWTVGAVLPRLLDAAKVERLRRDVAAAGWAVRTERDLPHGIFAASPAGIHWYLDLPADEDDFWRGPRGAAEVAWDYGAEGAAIVPEELLGDVVGLGAFLAALRAPGLMSAEQAASVQARRTS